MVVSEKEDMLSLSICGVVHKIAQGEKSAAFWIRKGPQYQRLLKAISLAA